MFSITCVPAICQECKVVFVMSVFIQSSYSSNEARRILRENGFSSPLLELMPNGERSSAIDFDIHPNSDGIGLMTRGNDDDQNVMLRFQEIDPQVCFCFFVPIADLAEFLRGCGVGRAR